MFGKGVEKGGNAKEWVGRETGRSGGSWSSKQGQVRQGMVGFSKTLGLHLDGHRKPLPQVVAQSDGCSRMSFLAVVWSLVGHR